MLTPRQKQIAGYVASGLSNKAIAHKTGLTVQTVNKHVANVADRIGGSARPRERIILWVFDVEQGDAA